MQLKKKIFSITIVILTIGVIFFSMNNLVNSNDPLVILEQIEFDKIESDGFAFQVEVLYQLKQKDLHGLEITTTFVNRTTGKSKMGVSEMIQFVRMCLSYITKK